jgi:pyridoxamine 5'-phosphate oxidase family protein
MSVFTQAELDYLAGQSLGRLATVGPDGQPHVVPVGFRYNPETDTIDIGGRGMGRSKKYRDVVAQPRVAFVVDDVAPPDHLRMLEIRGEAVALPSGGRTMHGGFDDQMIRVAPRRIVSMGLDDASREARGRDVLQGPAAPKGDVGLTPSV